MHDHMLVKIHQQELRAEADRERLVRLARAGQADRRQTIDRLWLMTRLRALATDLLRPQRPANGRTGAA